MKTTPALTVICFETQTSLRGIGKYIRTIAHELYLEAAKYELEILGPVLWIYNGADGKPDTIFKLTIAIPVSETKKQIDTDRFRLKLLDPFNYFSETHSGPWDQLGKTYESIISKIISENIKMSGQNREVYIQMNFEQPVYNITEVQVGIIV